uniref:DNA-directed RNA polymerase subunit P n=1 Tax=uncultured bacterium contig00088 TaxID=1181561 RepID=A0A806KHD1_9BACT|nr:hypothetical protein [uncultured bacterium contig00088]
MKCPYCDAEFDIPTLESYQKEIAVPGKDNYGWDESEAGAEWADDELNELSTGSCPSCGAELVGDQNTAAMVCPSCGNTQIVLKRLDGLLKPDYVIPFALDKKRAVESLKGFYKGKRLLPDSFKQENRINGIQGVYLPFWLFDAQADARIRYKASKVKTWSDSQYSYTKTDFYSVVREGSLSFEKIPVDGSEKTDDAYMDAIEPFDYKQLLEFQTAYLSGYLAEKYDVDAAKSKERAGVRIKNSIEHEFRKSVAGYASVSTENSVVDVKEGTVSYGFFPTWILNTKYKKENYLFIMNGQTGLLAGRLPVDSGKVTRYVLMIGGITALALTLIIQALAIFI